MRKQTRRRQVRPPRGVPLRLVFNRDDAASASPEPVSLSDVKPEPATTPDQDTVHELEQMLREAREGKLTGLACAVLYSGNRSSSLRVIGDAKLNPTFARGMVRALDDRLGDYQRGHV